ncbi:COX5B-domain-containing protein [Microthyrium microscopicum]|uniref:Cytochrome c oxidase subunit 4, mitochondrial n=1 Tax=Microthyrium microscopicum TaxID=703497 RepID=A0A6A6UC78_9PEZI|nr:COX5B-domain-containing protein [Microthyrium microscopicum]
MLMRRSATALLRQARPRVPIAARSFQTSLIRRDARGKDGIITSTEPVDLSNMKTLGEIKADEDLLPVGAPVGTVPTELNQATGLERLEILGKIEGVDIWDMRPLDTSRKGTMDNPVVVKSFGEEQYVGCTGVPADTHEQHWMVISRDRPFERCTDCGNVIKMEYTGPDDPHHGHPPVKYEPESFADYVKPDYHYK